ncbi:zinc finger (C2H2 type) family protein [Rhynchospora pubera]|uniref:Zinc finger (C2H2 type) family protein n=1 Tax=Rhynchospora pubera TaxID=906938 RepID=A0AAV8FFZ1_9POAL|nr:zinc finger (C2H2 type) family protein [Rhynchospora pubera]
MCLRLLGLGFHRLLSSNPNPRESPMTGKAKPKKHMAKEIAAKIDAATTNRGGEKAGQANRLGQEKGGHGKLECRLYKTTAPDIKSMQIHHEVRHPKLPFEPEKLNNLHTTISTGDSSKTKPGVRGSHKK